MLDENRVAWMQQFLNTETLIIELLLIASLVAIVVRRLRIPYTVALVVVGLLLTSQSTVKFELTPELILALFVPPLVFEAAFHLNLTELRRNLPQILVLAVPGVILTTLIVGGLLSFGTSLSLPGSSGLWRLNRRDRSGGGGCLISLVGSAQKVVRSGRGGKPAQ